MSDQSTSVPIKQKRSRKLVATEPDNPEIDLVDDFKPLNQHDVVQVISGVNRGKLSQIADFINGSYRCYIINPPSPPEVFTALPMELHFIGKGKVGSRTPLASIEPKPVAQEEPIDEDDGREG